MLKNTRIDLLARSPEHKWHILGQVRWDHRHELRTECGLLIESTRDAKEREVKAEDILRFRIRRDLCKTCWRIFDRARNHDPLVEDDDDFGRTASRAEEFPFAAGDVVRLGVSHLDRAFVVEVDFVKDRVYYAAVNWPRLLYCRTREAQKYWTRVEEDHQT